MTSAGIFAARKRTRMSVSTPSTAEETKLLELLEGCEHTFRRNGVRAVSMDDLARTLGVSKKTLYKFFRDKADLVLQVFDRMCSRQDATVCALAESGENAIDAVISTMEYMQGELREMHPSMLFDLKKYYPAAMARLEKHKLDNMQGYLLRNIERGQGEGYYRTDFDAKLLTRLYMSMVQTMTDPSTLEEFGRPLSELQKELHTYHLRGIATEKGMQYYHERQTALGQTAP